MFLKISIPEKLTIYNNGRVRPFFKERQFSAEKMVINYFKVLFHVKRYKDRLVGTESKILRYLSERAHIR